VLVQEVLQVLLRLSRRAHRVLQETHRPSRQALVQEVLQVLLRLSRRAHQALQEYPNVEQSGPKIAESIKKHFDEKWTPYWHVTVGKNFGCHLVYEKQRFVYFYIGQFAFLLYKAQ